MEIPPSPRQPLRPEIYSVSRLATEARQVLEGAFPLIWVEGELSNLARPRSGHLYFTLKDADAQIRCAMFRQRNRQLRFRAEDGAQVLARVRISLYTTRGDFQLIVEHMEPAGDGALRRAFENLQQRLQAEGLFNPERKRVLPSAPRRIGVVTSPSAAALRDVLYVLRRRFPALAVLIYPVPVQGGDAAGEIAAAIGEADARGEVDALLLTRGGGSLEDLWAFNEEPVARAIAECSLPIVSAVGHETDITIADFAADLRAATPSAGAEALSPDGAAWRRQVDSFGRRANAAVGGQLQRAGRALAALDARLRAQHPGRRLGDRAQRVDELDARLRRSARRRLQQQAANLTAVTARLHRCDPRAAIDQQRQHVGTLWSRLRLNETQRLRQQRARMSALARALDAVSPLATVARGYAVVRRQTDGAIVRDSRQVAVNESVRARIANGELICRIETVLPETEAAPLIAPAPPPLDKPARAR